MSIIALFVLYHQTKVPLYINTIYHNIHRNDRDNQQQYEPYYYRNHSNSKPHQHSVTSTSSLFPTNPSSRYYAPCYHASPQPSIPIYKWNNDESESREASPNITPKLQIESLSEPLQNPPFIQLNSLYHKHDAKHVQRPKRKRKNIYAESPRHIHPSMNHRQTQNSGQYAKHHKHTKKHRIHSKDKENDSDNTKKHRNSPKNKLEIVAPDLTGNLVDL